MCDLEKDFLRLLAMIVLSKSMKCPQKEKPFGLVVVKRLPLVMIGKKCHQTVGFHPKVGQVSRTFIRWRSPPM
jgi:hypothetical protein